MSALGVDFNLPGDMRALPSTARAPGTYHRFETSSHASPGPAPFSPALSDAEGPASDDSSLFGGSPSSANTSFDRSCSFRVGDWVIMGGPSGQLQIGQCTKVDDTDDGHSLSIWNYDLPEQTCHLASASFWQNEVFRSTRPSVWPCTAVVSRCCVISLAQAMTGLPKPFVWDRSTPLFVCQSKYVPELGVNPFVPVPNWRPLDRDWIDEFPTPRHMPHRSSPFLRGISGTGYLLRPDGLPYDVEVHDHITRGLRLDTLLPRLYGTGSSVVLPTRSPVVPLQLPTPNTPSIARFDSPLLQQQAFWAPPPVAPPIAALQAPPSRAPSPIYQHTSSSAPPPPPPRARKPTVDGPAASPTQPIEGDWPPADMLAQILERGDNPHAGMPGKPPYSYASIVAQAIHNSPNQRARLEQVYAFIKLVYPFYATTDSQWQNMLRHNLSLRPVFVKVARAGGAGKGSWWTMDMSLEPNGFNGLQFGTKRGSNNKRKVAPANDAFAPPLATKRKTAPRPKPLAPAAGQRGNNVVSAQVV